MELCLFIVMPVIMFHTMFEKFGYDEVFGKSNQGNGGQFYDR